MRYLKLLSIFILFTGFIQLNTFVFPDYFPDPEYNFDQNVHNQEVVELGRFLFYDPLLSKDGTISCASCHSPFNAFAHTDHSLSHGINDEIGTRNASALFNLAWHKSFMWDGAINHLDMQALAPLSHPGEMGSDINKLVDKLGQESFYSDKFNQAYGDSLITGEKILKALSQFQLTLVSSNSKYDKVRKGDETFNEQEINGYALFKQNCNSCHQEPLFSTYDFANNGLAVDTSLNDFGRGGVTRLKEDSLLFKIPSLRNLSYSYPYMHDGRFQKLNQVLNYYSRDLDTSSNVDHRLKKKISFTSNEKVDLIAFLLTLNDREFLFDKKHQFPKELLEKKVNK